MAKGLVDRRRLERWLATEVGCCLAAGNEHAPAVDAELGEYVARLLGHPDYCDSTVLTGELAEFLGDQAAAFVLALWKFLVVEVGLSLVFAKAPDALPPQSDTAEKDRVTLDSALEGESRSRKPHNVSTPDSRDYKRRRASYRGKVGTNTGIGALRELIAKHMAAIGEGDGDEAATTDKAIHGDSRSHLVAVSKQSPAASWWEFTDALRVRDMDRRGGRTLDRQRSGERSDSERNRSRSRSRQREWRVGPSSHRAGPLRSRTSSPRHSRRSRSTSASERRCRDSRRSRRRSRSRSPSPSRSRNHSRRGSRDREEQAGKARRSRERTGREREGHRRSTR